MLNQIDLSRADLNLLVLFEVVLEERNVGRSAERLRLSASAVSHGLGRLRRMLNDPLFLKNPKGVVPTARALELAEPIAEILGRVRGVVASSQRFDPASSVRRFTIGAPDGISAVVLPSLFAEIERAAPGVNLSVRTMMPQTVFAELDTREADIAIAPIDEVPPRFYSVLLHEEEFVIAMRRGHPLAETPTLERYCEASHLLVSVTGDPGGYVDEVLKKIGLSRRVALAVPNFMFALAVVAETELVAALPQRLVEKYAAPFGLTFIPAPTAFQRFKIRAIVPKAAMMDAGVGWLLELMARISRERA